MTILKIGFAMGGGIALGTFSGAALSEALKLAILRGHDKDKKAFDRVEVDVFSGASAGAMSLGLMLRSLTHQTDKQSNKALKALDKQFKNDDDYKNLSPEKKKDLIAAQVMQDIQYKAWVEEVDMEGLLDPGEGDHQLKETAGILNRHTVDKIAKKFFTFCKEDFPDGPDIDNKRILADRVLYASALSNLTPIIHDARTEFPTTKGGAVVLTDGLSSKTHRELRIFDLYLNPNKKINIETDANGKNTVAKKEQDKHPSRWMRYHNSVELTGVVGSLIDPEGKAWAKMAATAIASGAFPFAFEPVVLERKKYEYGGLWPKELKEQDNNSIAFTYSDGGTFNNEPIREAFRMASFIDAQDEAPEKPDTQNQAPEETERWIIFVDPYIPDFSTTFKVPVHQRFSAEKSQEKNSTNSLMPSPVSIKKLNPKNSIDRLIPQAFSMLSAISNQSRLIEGDKVFQVQKKFSTRAKLRPLIKNSLSSNPAKQHLKNLVGDIKVKLTHSKEESMIPAGGLTIEQELKRIIKEQKEETESLNDLSQHVTLFIESIDATDNKWPPELDKKKWLEALSYIMLDLSMDLRGKDETAKLISIGPIKNPQEASASSEKQKNYQSEKIDLPGQKMGAFGGFTYKPARDMDTQIAKWCAQKFLEVGGVIKTAPLSNKPLVLLPDQVKEYDATLKKDTKNLINRILTMLRNGHIPVLSSVPTGLILRIISWFKMRGNKLNKIFNPVSAITYEFRIKLPDNHYRSFNCGSPKAKKVGYVYIDNKPYLVVFAKYIKDKGADRSKDKWSSDDSTDQRLLINKKQVPSFPFPENNKLFCSIELPSSEMLKKADIMGYPVFHYILKDEDRNTVIPASDWESDHRPDGWENNPDYQPTLFDHSPDTLSVPLHEKLRSPDQCPKKER